MADDLITLTPAQYARRMERVAADVRAQAERLGYDRGYAAGREFGDGLLKGLSLVGGPVLKAVTDASGHEHADDGRFTGPGGGGGRPARRVSHRPHEMPDDFRRQAGDFSRTLDPAGRRGVKAYTAGTGYIDLNEQLRRGTDPAAARGTDPHDGRPLADLHADWQRLYDQSPEWETPVLTYRGLKLAPADAARLERMAADAAASGGGKLLRLAGWHSTTLRPEIAARFSGPDAPLLEIAVHKGPFLGDAGGGETSHFGTEAEILLPHNQTYRVLGVEDRALPAPGGGTHTRRVIRLEQVVGGHAAAHPPGEPLRRGFLGFGGERGIQAVSKALSAGGGGGRLASDGADVSLVPADDGDPTHDVVAALTLAVIEAKEQGDGGRAQSLIEYGRSLLDDPAELAKLVAGQGGTAQQKALRVGWVVLKGFDSSKHPRDDHGRFVSADAIHAAAADPAKAKELRKRVTDPEQRKKLDAALADPSTIARTKRGQAKHEAGQKRERKQANAARAKELAGKVADGTATMDDHRELFDHLEGLTHDQLAPVRSMIEHYARSRRKADVINGLKTAIGERMVAMQRPPVDEHTRDRMAAAGIHPDPYGSYTHGGEKLEAGTGYYGYEGGKRVGYTHADAVRIAQGATSEEAKGRIAAHQRAAELARKEGRDFDADIHEQQATTLQDAHDRAFGAETDATEWADAHPEDRPTDAEIDAMADQHGATPSGVRDAGPGAEDVDRQASPDLGGDERDDAVGSDAGKVPAVEKEPHEMTRAEHARKWVRDIQAKRPDHAHLYDAERAANPGWGDRAALAWSANANKERKRYVEAALAAGKPVPPEVLADYPDLAAKHGAGQPGTSGQ